MTDRVALTRDMIADALHRIGEIAAARGLAFEINVYGGAALALAYDMRASTLDVDAVPQSGAAAFRAIAAEVAQERQWPEDWVNDAVKGFLSGVEDMHVALEAPGLRVQVPSLNYLIAMKALAMRIDAADPKDLEDLLGLIERAGYTTAEQVLDVVLAHYPASRILPKTRYGVMDIVERLKARKGGA